MLSISAISNAEIYTWQDENGNTHFSDTKVEGRQQKQLDLKVQRSHWKKFQIDINDVDHVLTEQEKQQITEDVNNVYQFFDKHLYFSMYKTVPVKIRLYQTQQAYQRYLAQQYGEHNAKHSRGIYIRASNEIVLFVNPDERWRTFWTIKHETSHAIVDTVTPFVPAWLNEGLAENMEALSVEREKLVLKPHRENHALVARAQQQGQWLDVKDFLTLSSQRYYQQLQSGPSMNQANAGELVRLFLSTRPGKDFVIRLIHIYELGSRQYGAYIVDEHYIGGLTVLQNDWDRWVERQTSQQISL